MTDMKRLRRQRGLAKAWFDAGCQGTVEAATGFGKTRVALEVLAALVKKKVLVLDRLLVGVIVPSNYLKGQWEAQLQALGFGTMCKVRTVQSLFVPGVPDELFVDTLILDEVHRYSAEVFSQIFDRVKARRRLGLTATVPEDPAKRLVIDLHTPVVGTVPLIECIENGWVAPFTVFNLGIPMSIEERKEYKALNADFHKYFAVFDHNFDTAMKCLKAEAFRKWYAGQVRWDPQALMVSAVNWRRTMTKRMDLLYGLASKRDVALDVFQRFPDKKIVSFAQTVQTAEDLVSLHPGSDAVTYHGSMAKRVREENVEAFRNPDNPVRILTTAKALDEGADIPDVDLLMVVSGTASARQCGQRYGRGIRYVEGKHTVIIEVYCFNTQDETWLRKRQKNIPKDRIHWVTSMDQIEKHLSTTSTPHPQTQ